MKYSSHRGLKILLVQVANLCEQLEFVAKSELGNLLPSHVIPDNVDSYTKQKKKKRFWIYFETIFNQKLLVSFTNNYKEMTSNAMN